MFLKDTKILTWKYQYYQILRQFLQTQPTKDILQRDENMHLSPYTQFKGQNKDIWHWLAVYPGQVTSPLYAWEFVSKANGWKTMQSL